MGVFILLMGGYMTCHSHWGSENVQRTNLITCLLGYEIVLNATRTKMSGDKNEDEWQRKFKLGMRGTGQIKTVAGGGKKKSTDP